MSDDTLRRVVEKLKKQRDRGSGFDHGDMDADAAYDSALLAVINAIEEALSER